MSPNEDPLTSVLDDVRPLAIFFSYMVLCLSLTILILRTINLRRKASLPRTHRETASPSPIRLSLFMVLAVLSLATTWYYMFRFFEHSYRAWASSHNTTHNSSFLQLDPWLRDTRLFKEAWYSALATPARFWWTQQIFFFSVGWSIFLARQGHYYGIPHLWAFMLLGQVVAISFATNLFFLAVLVHSTRTSDCPSSQKQDDGRRSHLVWTPPAASLFCLLAVTFIAVAAIPYAVTSSHFMTILIVPHFVLFFPLILRRVVLSAWGRERKLKEAQIWYAKVYSGVVICATLLQAKATIHAMLDTNVGSGGASYRRIIMALYEHPAVSSVGWDVIFCWISWSVWALGAGWMTEGKNIDVGQARKKYL